MPKSNNMTVEEIKNEVALCGRQLLELGLVARTWGNISIRTDEKTIAISPSGLSYEKMTAEDVPLLDIYSKSFVGIRKPSSEMKIHIAAMKVFSEVNFCVHTHQNFATAVGLVGCDSLDMSEEERRILEKIEIADYAAPGTDELADNVEKALRNGAKIVLMLSHGVLICAKDKEDAMKKAETLEAVCKRNVEKVIGNTTEQDLSDDNFAKELYQTLAGFNNLSIFSTPQILKLSKTKGFKAQLDDMAQMIGKSLDTVPKTKKDIQAALETKDAIMVEGFACIVKADEKDDAEALKMLAVKAAICKAYTDEMGVSLELEEDDCEAMRKFYLESYSKRK